MSDTLSTATQIVDRELLESEVKAMYRDVALDPSGEFHFELGRPMAERLGYPPELLDAIPAEAVESFAGVGYHLDLAALRPGEHVLDLGCGSGTDVFCASVQVGRDGSVHGLDLTDEQVAKAERVRSAAGIEHVEFVGGHVDDLPFPDGTFDVVMSNGVINLASDKMRVFREIERVLRPGGRASIADIVSSTPLAERTVAKVELWAACVAGAVPGLDYLHGLEDVGLTIGEQRDNTEYHFISDRAATTCAKYGIKSVSLIAEKLPA